MRPRTPCIVSLMVSCSGVFGYVRKYVTDPVYVAAFRNYIVFGYMAEAHEVAHAFDAVRLLEVACR